MTKIKFYLAGIFCLGLTLGLTHFALADSTITGRILKTDGSPVVNNGVFIYNSNATYFDYTDDDGNYSITVNTAPISGNYTIKPAESVYRYDINYVYVHYEYFYPISTTSAALSVTDGVNQTKNFTLNQHGAVSGTVIDSSGNPIYNASIYFWNKNGQSFTASATTNYIGDYYATPLKSYSDYVTPASGNYQAYVSMNNYLPKYIPSITITDNQVVTENITLTRKSYISGNIKSKSGANLANIVVKVYRLGDNSAYAISQTDSNGNYSLELGRSGSYYSFGDFTAKGKYILEIAGDDTAAYNKKTKKISVKNDESSLAANFILKKKSGTFSGKIKTKKGKKIEGAMIKVNLLSDPRITSTTYSNTNGRFSFAHLTSGKYQITVSKDGYVNNDIASQRIKKGTYKIFKMATAGDISGYVFDKVTKKPLSGITVLLANSDLYANTNSQGYYIIKNVPTGNRKVYIRHYYYYEQFYKNADKIEKAKTIKVKKNKIRNKVNFHLTSYARTYR